MKTRIRALAAGLATAVALTLGTAAITTTAIADNHGDKMKAEVGKQAPDFELKDIFGKTHKLSDYTEEGKIVVLEWFNPDCPFVVKHHSVHKTMYDLYNEYNDDGVVWLAINSGAPGKQGAGLDRNRKAHKQYGIEYPILLDESGTVGHMYSAKTTPHMYIIDTEGVLRYAGAIDNNRSARELGEVNYVDQALSQVLAGKEVAQQTSSPYGCSVKYAY